MTDLDFSRRRFLGTTLALGCSAAASPFVTPVTLAVTPGDNRLVVIVLRGAMDGLDVVQPIGDRALRGHRRNLSTGEAGGAHDLDGFFMLHSELSGLMPLWQAGELSFAHAVSTPYRDKRSHFDGQDLLENGGNSPDGGMTPGRDGWLNRMLSLLPGASAQTAYAVGRENLLLLSGDAPASAWSPDSDMALSPQAQLLLNAVYRDDPLFRQAGEAAMTLAAAQDGNAMNPRQAARAAALAGFAAQQLSGQARVAAFSLNGWDTHQNQPGGLAGALKELQTAILTLKQGLGPAWGKTAVLCLTEFGRTVRENGNRGSDHGTGGAAIFAGGALRGQAVHGKWPGLKAGNLYRDRDLMPTADVRGYAAWAMRGLFGIDKGKLDTVLFPGVDLGKDPKLIA
ncbi:DUF1501 domain-containing protein [Rhodobacteraceae bacterium 2CG4]|uniref:DUF1501 domain-containing protein n=1 Tax=Halovulum marinum TaxID=2662447 RepID=A0A6L5YVJ7_9RHOB|nr:DUF1501 domain-containing protein [Halovulum marinum]MSU88267.1 DUF1501 domain-containing protein [Halovulum marinum]